MTIELPTLTLTLTPDLKAAKTTRRNKSEAKMDTLERKVVMNAGLLIETSDKHQQCVRKLAECLADAVGLCVDFSSLAA